MYQPKVDDRKRARIDSLRQRLEGVRDYVFVNYRGLNVQQITQLRTELRNHEAEFHVVKNRYALRVFQGLKLPDATELLRGPIGLALLRNEGAPVFKVLLTAANEQLIEIKGSIIDEMLLDAQQTKRVGRLPNRPVLLAMLMGAMNGPLQQLLYMLNAPVGQLTRLLKQIADKKNQSDINNRSA